MKFLRFFGVILVFLTCGRSGTSDLEVKLSIHRTEFTNVANEFLEHPEIKGMSIATEFDGSKCQSINRWRYCAKLGDNWESWNDTTHVYLDSRDDVLKREHIDFRVFARLHDFLRANEIESISRGYMPCDHCVEFESSLNGLRYYAEQPNDLKANPEYLYVQRLNANWFAYRRDWN